MKQLASITTNNKTFYLVSFLIFTVFGLFLLMTTKANGFIALNGLHSFPLNVFFVNYTFTGDGLFTLAICIYLFSRKQNKLAVCILAAYLTSGLLVQVLKNLVYSPRPRIYFEASQYLFHLDNFGNSGGGLSSFPSGHTTSAFALATVLAIYSRKKYFSILLLAAAMLTGYSRIYLAQHFPSDVLAGAFIGMFFGTLSFILLERRIKISFFQKKHPASQWDESLSGTTSL